MDHSGTTIYSPASVWKTRVSFAAMTTCRILLGIGMVPYAVNKILDYQFQVSAWSYGQQLGNVPGRALLWATMGYSPALQVFLGVLELVPAILLLFARTRRIGALAMFPVVLNVALLNFALDLWHDTKIISSGMLALNVFLLLYDWRIYVSFFTRLLAPDAPIANRKLRIAGKVAGFVLPVVAIAWFLVDDARLTREENNTATDFIGERQINGAGHLEDRLLRCRRQSCACKATRPFLLRLPAQVLFRTRGRVYGRNFRR